MKYLTNTLLTFPFATVLLMMIGCSGCGSSKETQNKPSISEKENKSSEDTFSNAIVDSLNGFDLGILKDAPMLPLEEADIKEVFDHYVLRDVINNFKYHLYDGNKQQTIEISPDEKFEISGNQKFMVRCTVQGNRLAKQHFLNITMLNTSNEVVCKGIIPAVGEDNYESHDYIYPLNNGKGFVIHSEETGVLTICTIQDNKFTKVGSIKQNEAIIVGFKMTDDASNIICLYYTEESGQYTLANYGSKQNKFSKKWEKKLNGIFFEFSQSLGNVNHYFVNSYQIDLVKQPTDFQFGIEVYDLSGNILLDKITSERLYIESSLDNGIITYVGISDSYVEYLNVDGQLNTINLRNDMKMDTFLNIRPCKLINKKDNIFLEFLLIPHYTHKNYMTGILSGISILPKTDLSKGKYYSIFEKNTLDLFEINDTIYFLKGYKGQFPETVKKVAIPILKISNK